MLINKKKVKKEVYLWALLIGSCLLRSFSVYAFILPNNFAPGGITGIAMMIDYAMGGDSNRLIPVISNTSLFLFLLNVPTVIISYFAFSKSYAIKTTGAMFMLSGFMVLVEEIEKIVGVDFKYVQNAENMQPILAAICSGVLNGIALAMILNTGGSNGGTDVLGGLIGKKYPSINPSWFITLLDAMVIGCSFFVFESAYAHRFTPIILSIISSYFMSKVCDTIMHGAKKATKFEIITSYPEELAQDLIKVLGRTVTRIDAEGMYSHQKKALLICVIRDRQIPYFYDVLKKYPDTFVYLSVTNEVIGRGYTRIVKPGKVDLAPIKTVDKKFDITKVVDEEDFEKKISSR